MTRMALFAVFGSLLWFGGRARAGERAVALASPLALSQRADPVVFPGAWFNGTAADSNEQVLSFPPSILLELQAATQIEGDDPRGASYAEFMPLRVYECGIVS